MLNPTARDINEDESMPAWLDAKLRDSLAEVRQGKTISVEELDAGLSLLLKELTAKYPATA
jgi:hypothetical protein